MSQFLHQVLKPTLSHLLSLVPKMDDASRQLQRLRQRAYVSRKRRDKTTNQSHWTLQTALCIALVLGYDFAAGADWLQQRRRRGTPLSADTSHAEVVELLEEVFLAADVDELALWTCAGHSPLQDTVLDTGQKYAREHRLAQRVRRQNSVHGVPVPSSLLVQHHGKLVEKGVAHSLQASGLIQSHIPLSAAGRVWASRWRQKHGGQHRALRSEEPISLVELQSKAARPKQDQIQEGKILCFSIIIGLVSGP